MSRMSTDIVRMFSDVRLIVLECEKNMAYFRTCHSQDLYTFMGS